jgi:hypothetical protein
MKARILLATVAVALLAASVPASNPTNDPQRRAAAGQQRAAFAFAGAPYFHRYTTGDQHEYTPAGQEDLGAWTDMITAIYYRTAKDGDALAATANAVLENYKANKGIVVKTHSVPPTPTRPAEHLIVVLFPRPEFIEAAFARFRLHDGVGTATVYSHRVYGRAAGNEMQAWLEKNGQTTETSLMKWDVVPPPGPAK